MSSTSAQRSGGNTAVIIQLRQALEGDSAALDEVIEHIRSEPEDFVAELQRAASTHGDAHFSNGNNSTPDRDSDAMPVLSKEETALFEKINVGLPASTWDRFNELRDRLDAETLTPEEHAELMSITYNMETIHAERLGHVLELAQLRGRTLDQMMAELGMVSPGVR